MKTIVGIFAHPDDEALGPSGTLAKLALDNDVYLLCATCGEAAGQTAEEKHQIGETRKEELRQSAKILGIKDVFFLGFEDGELKNNSYHDLAKAMQDKLEELQPETILTFEQHGVSGHIDHITVSMVATFVFHKLAFIKKLMYYCVTRFESDLMGDYFIYFPQGYTPEEADEIVDVSSVWETKLQAMQAHKSQQKDVDHVLETLNHLPKEELFLVRHK
jgi:LmbE family N-acetylglucosaminyl deacetylase